MADYASFYQRVADLYGSTYNASAGYTTYVSQAFDVVLDFAEEEKKDLLFPFRRAKNESITDISEPAVAAVRALQEWITRQTGLTVSEYIDANGISVSNGFAAISTIAGFPLSAN